MPPESGAALRRQFWRGMWEHAIFRWESAVVAGLTVLGVSASAVLGAGGAIPPWSWLACVLLGLVGEGALIYASLHDPDSHRKVVSLLLRARFRPEQLKDSELRQKVLTSLDYRSRIGALMRVGDRAEGRPGQSDLELQFDGWIGNVYKLAKWLDDFKKDVVYPGDHALDTGRRVEHLRALLHQERDQKTKQEIENTILSHEKFMGNLGEVERTVARANLKLEQSISQLGTIYSQTLLMDARGIESSRAQDLHAEIAAEVEQLDETVAAMERVYASSRQRLIE
ncbi:MAG TPA: hypothetical protein VLV76_00735 [Candidatus Acidoferrum sp.]|nr:hypothetical protein [Candidatus Acidoferrum sp.]